jgi:parvulin-like peptidyl-prolyl isomerase
MADRYRSSAKEFLGVAESVRKFRSSILIATATAFASVGLCARACAQEQAMDMVAVPVTATPPGQQPAAVDGSQVIARINGQVVQACELLWVVNLMLEKNKDKIPPDKVEEIRAQLMQRQLSSLVDRKLLYDAFRRGVPAENLPKIEENLVGPFEQQEIPLLMKQMNVGSRPELERELCRLGSSLNDAKRSFNERVIASEWMRSKIKVDEDISPIEIHDYYQEHLTDYDYPAQARWEELMIRKNRFKDPAEAYAELARLGNAAAQLAVANRDPAKPIFTDVAKAKSDGFTAKDGGQYDWTSKGAKKPPIDDVLFSLPVGQMSLIQESETGFHIIRVLERKEAGRKPFTEVQVKIRETLKDERLHVAQEKYLAELREQASIETIFTGRISADELAGRTPGAVKR